MIDSFGPRSVIAKATCTGLTARQTCGGAKPLPAQRDLTNAVAAFREAAELRPGWPDPFLGLARTFVYGLEDLDRGADALKEAQRHGYTPTDRETAQLADGYRARGNSLVRSARQLSGLPQETDYLTRAAEAYREALTLYSKAINFADVPRNIRLTQRALSDVQVKLDELSRPGTEPAVPGDSPTVGAAAAVGLGAIWKVPIHGRNVRLCCCPRRPAQHRYRPASR